MLDHSGLLFCDLTQSWSETGGGIGTYLRRKRRFLENDTSHNHLLIVPGSEDRIHGNGRMTIAEVKSPRVPGSPNYRLLLRNTAVRSLLDQLKPDFVESLDPYNLPWAAINYRRQNPASTAIAGYRTDFPNAHIGSFVESRFGRAAGCLARKWSHSYAGKLYRNFDGVYALNAHAKVQLESQGISSVDLLPLGVNLAKFSPCQRDPEFRRQLGVGPRDPLLIYAGRLDREKRVLTVFEAFRRLPASMSAHLLLLGEGKCRAKLLSAADGRAMHVPGYEKDRVKLARALASSDIYVSAMPFETFGISIIEAQAAGLPIVGVEAGAMRDRVPHGTGLLGPVDDADAMAANIRQVWESGAPLIGERGRKLVNNAFSWQHTFDTLFNVIYANAHVRRAPKVIKPKPAAELVREAA